MKDLILRALCALERAIGALKREVYASGRPGRHSKAYASIVPSQRAATATCRGTFVWSSAVPAHVVRLYRPLAGEDSRLVRPYVLALEQARERRVRRERRTAAALATMGIDYDLALVAA